ncbi:hypothetical protein [Agromyces sp. NPDC058104]|uniref:hypothetical protein n=1 Tax=Agromyces sp. NPDC058104 TaxID=3346342 RepID=UPI0036DCEAF6
MTFPLPIAGEVRPEDVEAIRAAKISLAPPFNVTIVEAVPGEPGRVLALRERPGFVCDHALVPDPSRADVMRDALWWVLDERREDPRATSFWEHGDMMLGAILGAVPLGFEQRPFSWDDDA